LDSFFDSSNDYLFISQNLSKKYSKINVSDYKVSKIKLEDLPTNPFKRINYDEEIEYLEKDIVLRKHEWYILKFDYDYLEIFVKD
jgi:hypothetical protein